MTMHSTRIIARSPGVAGLAARANLVECLLEPARAPGFQFDFACYGPVERERARYVELRELISALDRTGRFPILLREAREDLRHVPLEVKWRDQFHNLVVTQGRDDILDIMFDAATQITSWFLGLKGTGSAAAGDTLASHGGWSEVNPYSGNRPGITFGEPSSGSLSASSAVSYSITGSATVAGAFICSVNTGTSGRLYSAGDFASPRSVANGDTLNVTPTVSMS